MVMKKFFLGLVASGLILVTSSCSSSRATSKDFKPNETQVTYREFWDAACADEYIESSNRYDYAKTVVKYKREGKEVNYSANPDNSYTFTCDLDKKIIEMDSSVKSRCYKYYVENGKTVYYSGAKSEYKYYDENFIDELLKGNGVNETSAYSDLGYSYEGEDIDFPTDTNKEKRLRINALQIVNTYLYEIDKTEEHAEVKSEYDVDGVFNFYIDKENHYFRYELKDIYQLAYLRTDKESRGYGTGSVTYNYCYRINKADVMWRNGIIENYDYNAYYGDIYHSSSIIYKYSVTMEYSNDFTQSSN